MGRAATLAAVAMLALPAGAQEDGCGGDPCCECFAECPRDGTDADAACHGQCEGGACVPTVDLTARRIVADPPEGLLD